MYLGDFALGSTVFLKFTTVNSTGAPVALSSGGVTVYRNGSTVQDTTGVALTASFDTIVGLNDVVISMSTVGFYSSAGDYTAILSSGAGSEDLSGYVLGSWSLINRRFLSTAGLETLSTVGIETLSTVGLETLSTAGLETLSSAGLETLSTVGLETLSTVGLETASSLVTVAGLVAISTGTVIESVTSVVDPTTIVDGVWDEPLTGASHNDPTSAGRRLRQIEEAFVHASGIIQVVTDDHTFTLDAGATSVKADFYIGDRLSVVEGVGAAQSRLIVAYSSDKVAILDSDFLTTPSTTSLYEIDAADVHVSVSDADLAEGFIAVYTNTTTFTLGAPASTLADFYKDDLIVTTHGPGKGQAREIIAYTEDRVVTVSPPLITDLSTSTVFHIQVGSVRASTSSTIATVTTVTGNVTGSIGSLSTAAALGVSDEVKAVVVTDTYVLPIDLPSTLPTLVGMMGYQHAGLRNQIKVTSSGKTFYDPAGNVQWVKGLIDDGTTYVELLGSTST